MLISVLNINNWYQSQVEFKYSESLFQFCVSKFDKEKKRSKI